jgi:hypothetical protein
VLAPAAQSRGSVLACPSTERNYNPHRAMVHRQNAKQPAILKNAASTMIATLKVTLRICR